MTFQVDFAKHRIIDLSMRVEPNKPAKDDRPFEMVEGRLPDGTYKFDIVKTHSHVGTHIESPWHYFHEGKALSDFPLEKFMGQARLFRANPIDGSETIGVDDMKAQLDEYRNSFTILVLRNDSGLPALHFDMETVPYIRDLAVDLLVFEPSIHFGNGIEDGRKVHEILMKEEICFVEFPANLGQLDKDSFYLFSVPIHVYGIDSAMCRLFAVL